MTDEETARRVERHGQTATFDLSSEEGPRGTDCAILNEVWVEDVYRLDDIDLRGRVVVDLGAHMGAYAVRAAQLGAEVFAYEVEPRNIDRIRKHVSSNNLVDGDDVHVTCAAVVAAGYQQRDYVMDESTGMATVTPAGSQRLERRHTAIIAISDIIEDATRKDPDVCIAQMKVDIEGCEYEALLNAPLHQVDRLAIEFHRSDRGDVGMLLEHILRTHSIDAFGDPRKGGMIYARRYGS